MNGHLEPPGRIWDSGLQPERTSLAWQRVNLAGLGASLVSARLVVEVSPAIGYTLAALGCQAPSTTWPTQLPPGECSAAWLSHSQLIA